MQLSDEVMVIKRLARSDAANFGRLVRLFREVFQMDDRNAVADDQLAPLLDDERFIAYAIIRNNDVLGGLTAYLLPGYYRPSCEVFIYDVAIHPDHQRKGLGWKLFTSFQEYCGQHGLPEIFVSAHEEDTHALSFYRAMGAKAEKVVHFNFGGQ
jgi:aminoglycoside 3-N-acetyltransferase I